MLIVHPRIRMDYYSGKPDMEAFEKASAGCLFLFAIMGIYLQQQLMDVSVKNIQISVIG